MQIITAATPSQFDAARALFREYAEQLGVSLCCQGFAQELAVETMYAPPAGSLLLLGAGEEFKEGVTYMVKDLAR